jgi:DNA-directed RNA polymerase I subunit RPA1
MTASRKPKTPSMIITIAKGISDEQADAFARRASRVTLSQVVDRVIVNERLTVNNQARKKRFTILINFYPQEEYRAEFDVSPKELLQAFGLRFPLTLKREIQLEMKKLAAHLKSQIDELGKGRTVPQAEGGAPVAAGDAEEDEGVDVGEPATRRDDDEESEVGDGDASREKRQRQKEQHASYESDEDEDTEGDIEPPEEDPETASTLDVEGAANDELENIPGKAIKFKDHVSVVKQQFLDSFPHATGFDFSSSRCTVELEVSRARPGFYGDQP